MVASYCSWQSLYNKALWNYCHGRKTQNRAHPSSLGCWWCILFCAFPAVIKFQQNWIDFRSLCFFRCALPPIPLIFSPSLLISSWLNRAFKSSQVSVDAVSDWDLRRSLDRHLWRPPLRLFCWMCVGEAQCICIDWWGLLHPPSPRCHFCPAFLNSPEKWHFFHQGDLFPPPWPSHVTPQHLHLWGYRNFPGVIASSPCAHIQELAHSWTSCAIRPPLCQWHWNKVHA